MEYGNGIVGDMCVHMLDITRWMLELGMAESHCVDGRASSSTRRARPTSPTRRRRRSDFGELPIVWTSSSWRLDSDPKYPWGATIYGDKGTLKASVDGLHLHPAGKGEKPITRDVTYELEQYPEDQTEKDLERHVAPAIRAHMKDLLELHRHARQARGGYRAG